jgi:glycerophosphoryl diester phosphodiesterase
METRHSLAARTVLPIVIAHRGASGYVPEHTLAGYYLAVQQGADCIEPDLVSTADGVLVARHENEISGTTDVAARPEFAHLKTTRVVDGIELDGWFTEDFTLAELKTLRARERIADLRAANARFDGQLEIATVDEILDLVAGLEKQRAHAARARHEPPPRPIGVHFEIKHASYFAARGLAMEAPLVEALRRHDHDDVDAPVFLQSFEVGNLQALRGMTQAPLMQLMEAQGAPWDLAVAGDSRNYASMATRRGLAQIATYADAIGVHKTLVIPRTAQGRLGEPTHLVADAHAEGLAVHAWTFRAENHFLPVELRVGDDPAGLGDLEAEIYAYFKAGVDGVFADQAPFAVKARDAWLGRF